jgi:hypothetical protein
LQLVKSSGKNVIEEADAVFLGCLTFALTVYQASEFHEK